MNETESFINEFNYTTSEVSLPMKAEAYVAVVIILILIGVFGFTLNLFVIILMCKDKQLWTPLNMVLFNLVCSDFSVSILGNPWTLSSAVYRRWIFGKMMCKMYGFFMSLLGISSITTLTVLAFERYIIIAQPFHSFQISRREALISILLIWIYSSILTIPPLIGWGDYISEGANISCSVNWEDQSYHTMTYIVFLFIFGLAIPVFVITFSYVNIILTMKKTNLRTGRVSKSEGRITTMILMMIITFLIAWSPYAIVALIIQFGDAKLITPALSVIPALLAKSSICYNPIIYVGMNTQFRQSWKQVFGRPEQSETKSGMMLHTIFSNTSVRNVTYIKSEFYNNEFQTTVINNEGDIDNVQYELINLSDNVTDNTNPLIVNSCNGDSTKKQIVTIEEKYI